MGVARQVFWLVPSATPSRFYPVAEIVAPYIELTAAGTAADFHGIPFSSPGVEQDP